MSVTGESSFSDGQDGWEPDLLSTSEESGNVGGWAPEAVESSLVPVSSCGCSVSEDAGCLCLQTCQLPVGP